MSFLAHHFGVAVPILNSGALVPVGNPPRPYTHFFGLFKLFKTGKTKNSKNAACKRNWALNGHYRPKWRHGRPKIGDEILAGQPKTHFTWSGGHIKLDSSKTGIKKFLVRFWTNLGPKRGSLIITRKTWIFVDFSPLQVLNFKKSNFSNHHSGMPRPSQRATSRSEGL